MEKWNAIWWSTPLLVRRVASAGFLVEMKRALIFRKHFLLIFHETVIPNFVGAIFGAANNVSAEYFISNRCTSRTTLYKRGLRFIEILLHVSLTLPLSRV